MTWQVMRQMLSLALHLQLTGLSLLFFGWRLRASANIMNLISAIDIRSLLSGALKGRAQVVLLGTGCEE